MDYGAGKECVLVIVFEMHAFTTDMNRGLDDILHLYFNWNGRSFKLPTEDVLGK